MKTALICGILNERSIAFSIAEILNKNNYRIIATYQNETIKNKVQNAIKNFNNTELFELDVSNQNSIENLVQYIKSKKYKIDSFLHSIAFSDRNELKKNFFNITRDNFLNSMNISCFSFIEMIKLLLPHMSSGSSALTVSYYGSQKVIPHYNVMGIVKSALEASVKYLAEAVGKNGIRVNALSAGPIKTISSFGISDFDHILHVNKASSPLRRNTTLSDIAGSGLYLLTEQSSGVTGEIHYVDCGYNIVGMENPYYEDEQKK